MPKHSHGNICTKIIDLLRPGLMRSLSFTLNALLRRRHFRRIRHLGIVEFSSPRWRCRPGVIFLTRHCRPKAASSAAFRQRRKIGAGFWLGLHAGQTRRIGYSVRSAAIV
jgi:hypothetical protein